MQAKSRYLRKLYIPFFCCASGGTPIFGASRFFCRKGGINKTEYSPITITDTSEHDFRGWIFGYALLKYSAIRQDCLRFVPRLPKNPAPENSPTQKMRIAVQFWTQSAKQG